MLPSEQKLVGLEVHDAKVDLQGSDVVGSAKLVHVGKLGGVELSIKANLSAKPLLNKAIDWVEEKIPGDQKAWAKLAKDALDKAFS